MKIVTIDMDETLGYFVQYGIVWYGINHYIQCQNKPPLMQSEFNLILDLYPEFLRPNIIEIMTYLKYKKNDNACKYILIYTNNNGAKRWINYIVKYIEYKIDGKIVDQIIVMSKYNKYNNLTNINQIKSYTNLIACARINPAASICFIDNTFFPGMVNDKVYYINVKSYYHDLPFKYIIDTFKTSKVGIQLIADDGAFDEIVMQYIRSCKYNVMSKLPSDYEVDKQVGQNIMEHLRYFFDYFNLPAITDPTMPILSPLILRELPCDTIPHKINNKPNNKTRKLRFWKK